MTPRQADEAISGMMGAASALWWLEALFKAMSRNKDVPDEIKHLVDLGTYVACDIANLTDCMVESLEDGEVQ